MGDFQYQEAGCGEELDQFSYINALPPLPGTPELPEYCKAPLYEAPDSPSNGTEASGAVSTVDPAMPPAASGGTGAGLAALTTVLVAVSMSLF
jgi:hypothetical protein